MASAEENGLAGQGANPPPGPNAFSPQTRALIDRRLLLGLPGLVAASAAGTFSGQRLPRAFTARWDRSQHTAHRAELTAWQVPGQSPKQTSTVDWLNVVTQYGADPTGASDSTSAIQRALSAAIGAGGGVVYLPVGKYKTTSTITGNVSNTPVLILGDLAWGTRIDFAGSGDCLRLYDSSDYGARTSHGSGISGLTIDGSGAGARSAGLHAGDILQFGCDITVQNFSASGSIGIHFDNNYYWMEQLYGRIYAQNCRTNVMFDQSADLSGRATGSFERLILDVFLDTNGLGDGVTFTNGAITADHRLGIYGNFLTATTPYAVLRITGSNKGGYSGLTKGVLNIGVELNDNAHTAPYTIYFGSLTGHNYITQCTGFVDFSLDYRFTSSNNTGQFLFSGPVFGDSALFSQVSLGSPEFGESVTGNGQVLYTQWLPTLRAQPGATSYTGLILAAGGYPGQQVTVINEGTGSLRFADAATSNVADGTSDVIHGNTARAFAWDSATSLWYRLA
jgi:hypothetical protein